jgi:hypothetical protein
VCGLGHGWWPSAQASQGGVPHGRSGLCVRVYVCVCVVGGPVPLPRSQLPRLALSHHPCVPWPWLPASPAACRYSFPLTLTWLSSAWTMGGTRPSGALWTSQQPPPPPSLCHLLWRRLTEVGACQQRGEGAPRSRWGLASGARHAVPHVVLCTLWQCGGRVEGTRACTPRRAGCWQGRLQGRGRSLRVLGGGLFAWGVLKNSRCATNLPPPPPTRGPLIGVCA